MWYENPNLVYYIIKASVRRPHLFSKLTSLSYEHYSIGVQIMSNTKTKLGCRCNCEKNKEFKIIDETRKLHCEGCADSIDLNCWKKSDYYATENVHKNVCKKCYKDHWYNVMKRKMSLCIKEVDNE